jgi:hypothetical protein
MHQAPQAADKLDEFNGKVNRCLHQTVTIISLFTIDSL